MKFIDHRQSSLDVNAESGRTRTKGTEFLQNPSKTLDNLGAGHGGIKLGFSRTGYYKQAAEYISSKQLLLLVERGMVPYLTV